MAKLCLYQEFIAKFVNGLTWLSSGDHCNVLLLTINFAAIRRSLRCFVKQNLPLIHSRRVVVIYKRKYVHKLLVNGLFKPAQEKEWLGELTVPQ